MKGSGFISDGVNLLYYKCHKINFKRGGLYIDSPNWIKKKKATINPTIDNDAFLKCAAANHEKKQKIHELRYIMKALNHIQKEFQILNHS